MKSKFKFKNILFGVLIAGIIAALLLVDRSDDTSQADTVVPSEASLKQSSSSEPQDALSAKQKASEEPRSLEEEFFAQELNEELDWVAEAFEQQSRYPANSRPVLDADLARSPEPFEEAEVEMRLPDENGELSPIGLSASVDKMRYFLGETITLQLLVSGLEANQSIAASANVKEQLGGDLLPVNIQLSSFAGAQTAYRAEVETTALAIGQGSKELLAKFVVLIDEQEYVTTVPFFLSQSSARLDNVALSQPEGAYLNIPLEYSVFEAGYYFVSAYLDDAATGRPLLALETEGAMNAGNGQLMLRAHHQALKDAGSPGPYHLRVMKSFRGAEPGGGNDVPTAVSQAIYNVPGFAFASYEDIPYSDPAVEERLQALRDLGSGAP